MGADSACCSSDVQEPRRKTWLAPGDGRPRVPDRRVPRCLCPLGVHGTAPEGPAHHCRPRRGFARWLCLRVDEARPKVKKRGARNISRRTGRVVTSSGGHRGQARSSALTRVHAEPQAPLWQLRGLQGLKLRASGGHGVRRWEMQVNGDCASPSNVSGPHLSSLYQPGGNAGLVRPEGPICCF